MDIIRFDCHGNNAPAYSCNKPGDNTGDYIRLEDATNTDNKRINWMVRYMLDEGFGEKHLESLQHIVGLMNDCEDSEAEILAFAKSLRDKYAS